MFHGLNHYFLNFQILFKLILILIVVNQCRPTVRKCKCAWMCHSMIAMRSLIIPHYNVNKSLFVCLLKNKLLLLLYVFFTCKDFVVSCRFLNKLSIVIIIMTLLCYFCHALLCYVFYVFIIIMYYDFVIRFINIIFLFFYLYFILYYQTYLFIRNQIHTS